MKIKQTFQQVRKIKPTCFSVSGHLPFKNGISVPYESTLERDFLLYSTLLTSLPLKKLSLNLFVFHLLKMA